MKSGIGLLLLTINSSNNYYCDEIENVQNMNESLDKIHSKVKELNDNV